MHNETYTENLAEFGFQEISMLAYILNAWTTTGLPDSFDTSGVRPALNKMSGNVFLVNEDYQVAMMNGDKLEVFHSTPYNGYEGFLSDLVEEYSPNDLRQDDIDYILDAADIEGFDLSGQWLDVKIDRILEQETE